MKHNMNQLSIKDGAWYDAVIAEAKEHTSKITGNISYGIRVQVKVSEISTIIADKYFPNDYEPDSELYKTLESLGAIDEEGIYDDEFLIGKEVQVTLKTTTYEGKKQRRIEDIILP